MDLNHILIWMVLMFSVVQLGQLIYVRSRQYDWLAAIALPPLVLAVGWVIQPKHAGEIAGAVWAVLVLLPALGFSAISRLSLRTEYGKASRLAAVVRLLHPFGDLQVLPAMLGALDAAKRGNFAEAERVLARFQSVNTPIGQTAHLIFFRLQSRWEECRAWIEANTDVNALDRRQNILPYYLRALGETCDLNALVEQFARYRRALAAGGMQIYHQALLFVFAFCGYTPGVEALFAAALSAMPKDMRRYWLLTAQAAAGDLQAREGFQSLASDDVVTRLGIERRLTVPLAQAEAVLTPENRVRLTEFDAAWQQTERYRLGARSAVRPYATYVLVALCVAMFVAEMVFGGSTSERTLYRLGAMETRAFWAGEWWRLLAAQFLHFGWLHLTMNMLALFIFGPAIESRLGRGRYLFVYLASGIGALALVILLAGHHEQMVVGASAGIMGLIGALLAIMLTGWLRERAVVARNQLFAIGAIVIFQTTFDLMTPQVSSVAHLAGAALGFLLTMLALRGIRNDKKITKTE